MGGGIPDIGGIGDLVEDRPEPDGGGGVLVRGTGE